MTKVGIGTTDPDATLHVHGEFNVGGGTRLSHFNYSTNKDVYIRSGEYGGKVIIQDGDTEGKVSEQIILHIIWIW